VSAPTSGERLRFPGVRAPKPLLAPETERRLTARQRQLLDELEELVVSKGLADLTMAEIAAAVNCSLRTLYGISPSREELILTLVDRRLHRIGRAGIESLDVSLAPLAHVLGGLGREFTRPDVAEMIERSPKATANTVTEIILRGLERS